MFAVLYSFTVKPNKQEAFVKAWAELTKLIYKYEGSLGSRLHQKTDTKYIAYAQWPSEAVFKNSGGNLPPSADAVRQTMRDCCEKIEVLHELEMLTDLLKSNTKND